MVFATTCFGEERKNDTLHFLNDIRNLDYIVFVITNIELHLEYYQFYNVKVIKVGTPYYHDFFRYRLILEIFKETNEEYVYYLDSDSRFFNFRDEKFNKENFNLLIKNKEFDILTAWLTDSVSSFFDTPLSNENKKIRQFSYGYSSFIEYMSVNFPSYTEHLNLHNSWEGHLIFKKNKKTIKFLEEIIKIGELLISEDIKNNREQIACTSSSLISLLSKILNIDLKMDSITHYFFKANFLKEVFPYNYKINIHEKIFINND
jgi:hypothetical protein